MLCEKFVYDRMTTRTQREKAGKQNDRHQAILADMLKEEANKYCVDCRAKGILCFFASRPFVLTRLAYRNICLYRTSLGLVESWSFHLHPLRWHTPKSWRAYFARQVSELGLVDARADRGVCLGLVLVQLVELWLSFLSRF